MNNHKILSLSLLSSVLVLAGCTQTQTTSTTNATVNENILPAQTGNVAVVTNINEAVINENTNTTDTSEEVDTSDPALSEVEGWLTYTNDIILLTFRYPEGWKLERNQDGSDFTDILDNNNIYDHELVNIYVSWSNRHEDIVYDSGLINTSLDKWLSCDYVYDLQSKCNTVLINGIEVVKREGQIEPPFGDDYVALAYKQNDFTVIIDARSLLRESSNGVGNNNLDGLKYINAVIKTMSIN